MIKVKESKVYIIYIVRLTAHEINFLFDILPCMRLLYMHKLYITHARESASLDRMREPSAHESVTKYSQRMTP